MEWGAGVSLTKPNQELRRYLKGIASDLKWSAVELMRIADRLSLAGNEADAQAVLRQCQVFQAGEDKLVGLVYEVKAGDCFEGIRLGNLSNTRPSDTCPRLCDSRYRKAF